MDKFVIQGGVALRGEVETSTAKNSVLPLLAAVLLTREPCRIVDVPKLSDVETMLTMTGAQNFLEIHPDQASAIKSFGA